MPIKETLADAYRATAAPIGRRRVRSIPPGDLPAWLRRPLLSLFEPVLTPEEEAAVERVQALRAALDHSDERAQVYNPAGSFEADGRHLARRSSVDRTWGAFLHLSAASMGARTIVELGSSAGFSGCFLASAPSCERFVTVEMSPSLAALARRHLGQVTDKATVITGDAEGALIDVLPSLTEGVDLAYLDAHKTKAPLLACVDRLAGAMREGGAMIFDDIRYAPAMWAAWADVRARPDVATTVDVGRFGVAVWSRLGGGRHVDLSKALGWFRLQHPDATA